MATKGLMLSIRSLRIGNNRQLCATTTRGCFTSISDNARVPPLQTHFDPRNKLQMTKDSTEEIKAFEFSLTARLAEPVTNTSIRAPGFNKTNIIIGHVPVANITAILDPTTSASLIGDVVPNKLTDVVGDNPQTANKQPAYKARHIQKIRRWKMNRHNLLKQRKRNRTKLIKRSMEKTKKKVAQNVKICEAIKRDGEQFDALEFVKERLALAKTGGFVHDIWRKPDDQPLVPWRPYENVTRQLRTYEPKEPLPRFITQAEKRQLRKEKRKKQL